MEGRKGKVLMRKMNFMKMVQAGAGAKAGSRSQRRKEEAIEKALKAKSIPEAAKILRRMK